MSESQVQAAMDMGYKDAQDKIKNGAAESLETLIHYHAMKKSGDDRINKHTLGSFTEAKRNGEFSEYKMEEDPHMKKYQFLMG